MAHQDLINVAGVDSNGRLKLFVTNPSDMTAVERARLYHAAPDLLRACERILRSIEWSNSADQMHPEERRELLRSAIEKATDA